MRFPAAFVKPPMRLLVAPSTKIPDSSLGIAAAPMAFVPIKFPRMRLSSTPSLIRTPLRLLPEITFRSFREEPPITLPSALILMPLAPFPKSAAPTRVTPMWLQAITLSWLSAKIPCSGKPPITSPRTSLLRLPTAKVRPFPAPKLLPSKIICKLAGAYGFSAVGSMVGHAEPG